MRRCAYLEPERSHPDRLALRNVRRGRPNRAGRGKCRDSLAGGDADHDLRATHDAGRSGM
jgi:hypothetical protein